MRASLYNVSCGSLRSYPLHASRVRVRGVLLFGYFFLAKQEKVTSRRPATSIAFPLLLVSLSSNSSPRNRIYFTSRHLELNRFPITSELQIS